jgi:hypothetical protein
LLHPDVLRAVVARVGLSHESATGLRQAAENIMNLQGPAQGRDEEEEVEAEPKLQDPC